MLKKIFERYHDYALLILRVFLGFVFLAHGALKLFGGLGSFENFLQQIGLPLPTVTALVVSLIEFLGGLAIVLGTATRLAALLLSAVMVVAIITVTWERGFAGGYDLNLALLGGLLCLLLAGPGKAALGGDL